MRISGLSFGYPGHTLIAGLDATITPGVTVVRGGDGRGKTTLLRLLAGELHPALGDMALHGELLERQVLGTPHVFRTDPASQAFDQHTLTGYWDSLKAGWPLFDASRLPALVEGLGLQQHLHKQLFMLSTGTKRKVWLAAAFASGAPVLLLDEPFAALDAPSMAFVTLLLQQASAQTRQAVVVADYEAPEGVRLAGTINLGD